jgi:hypothetical protein
MKRIFAAHVLASYALVTAVTLFYGWQPALIYLAAPIWFFYTLDEMLRSPAYTTAEEWLVLLGSYLPVFGVTLYLLRPSKPPPNHVCVACGYNLTGNASGVCPECGTAVTGKVGT